MLRIGVDLMGGDQPPSEQLLPFLEGALNLNAPMDLHLFVDLPIFQTLSSKFSSIPSLHLHVCEETILMTDEPLSALRKKPNSSLVQSVKALQSGQIEGLVTAANTGALMAAATHYLPHFPELRRTALLAQLPSRKGLVTLLDLGGILQIAPERYWELAALGVATHQALCPGETCLRVGLLNVGSESHKGSEQLQKAYALLREESDRHWQGKDYQFVGNVEARDIFTGDLDLVVTDGYTGNMVLKSAEGVAEWMMEQLLQEGAAELGPRWKRLERRFHYGYYPGSLLAGLQQPVVKLHGNGKSQQYLQGLEWLVHLLQDDVMGRAKSLWQTKKIR